MDSIGSNYLDMWRGEIAEFDKQYGKKIIGSEYEYGTCDTSREMMIERRVDTLREVVPVLENVLRSHPAPTEPSREGEAKHRRRVAMAAVGALRKAMVERALGLSESQAILIDEVVSPLIREAVQAALSGCGDE